MICQYKFDSATIWFKNYITIAKTYAISYDESIRYVAESWTF